MTKDSDPKSSAGDDGPDDGGGGDGGGGGGVPDGGYGWVVVGASFVIHSLTIATLFSLSVMYVEWLDEFKAQRSTTSLTVSICATCMFAIGPVPAFLADRYGYRIICMVGGLLGGLCLSACCLATSLTEIIVLHAIAGGFLGFSYLPCIAVVALYFNKRRALSMGIATAGTGAGAFVQGPLLNYLISVYGWRGAMLILGGIHLHLLVCGLLLRPLKLGTEETCEEQEEQEEQEEEEEEDHIAAVEVMINDGLNEPLLLSKGDAASHSNANSNSKLFLHDNQSPPPHGSIPTNIQAPVIGRILRDSEISVSNSSFPNAATSSNNHNKKQTLTPSSDRQISQSVQHLSTPHHHPFSSSYELGRPGKTSNSRNRLHGGSKSSHYLGGPRGSLRKLDVSMIGSIHSLALLDRKHLYPGVGGTHRHSSDYIIMENRAIGETKGSPPALTKAPSCDECESVDKADVTLTAPGETAETPVMFLKRTVVAFVLYFSLLTDRGFLALCISNILTNLSYLMPVLYMVDRAIREDIDKDMAAYLISINGIGNIIGRPTFGYLAGHSMINCRALYVFVLVMCGLGTCLSPLSGQSFVLHAVYAAFFGSFMGAYVTLTPLVAVDLLGPERVGQAYGILLLFMGISGAVGPPLGGWIYGETGTFTASYIIHGLAICLAAVAIAPVVFCRRCMSKGS